MCGVGDGEEGCRFPILLASGFLIIRADLRLKRELVWSPLRHSGAAVLVASRGNSNSTDMGHAKPAASASAGPMFNDVFFLGNASAYRIVLEVILDTSLLGGERRGGGGNF